MAKIGVIVGSLRKDSFSKKVAHHAVNLIPENHTVEYFNIGDLPIYNQDFDGIGPVPEGVNAFRDKATTMDAFLFVTPEYNRSVPGGLKNALDIGSRPIEQSVWKGKPAAIISVSPGKLGGFGANHHLRQSLVFFDMPVVQQPEAYVGNIAQYLDGEGKIQNEYTNTLLDSVIAKFMLLIEKYV